MVKYRRLQYTVGPELDQVLLDLSRLRRKPQASILREYVEAAVPAMQKLVQALEAAELHGAEVRAVMRSHPAAPSEHQQDLPLRRRPGRPRRRVG